MGAMLSVPSRVSEWVNDATDAWVCLALFKKLNGKTDIKKALLRI
jgi:hypothetical protein